VEAVGGADLDNVEGHSLLKSVIGEAESTSLVAEPLMTEVILKYLEASGADAQT
jgi:hypothetical protein